MWKYFILMLVIGSIITGCSKTNQSPPASATSIVVVPATSLPTRNLPTQIASPTITPVPTSTIIPTVTPIIKLPTKEALHRILELYENNGNCELPCWWGITPGITTWLEVSQHLSPIGNLAKDHFIAFLPEKYDPLKGPLPEGYKLGEVDTSLYIEDNVVRSIVVNSRWVRRSFDYSLAGILNTWGEPDEIWVRPFPESLTGTPHYDIDLLYSAKGMVLSRGFAQIQGDLMIICPQNVLSYDGLPPWFILWSPEENVTFRKNNQILKHFLPTFDELFVSLKDISYISIKQFYEIYRIPNTSKCLKFSPYGKP